ncbi:MAG: acyl-CoA dehydrogenase family protein [Acidimicrobiia bacterium]
MDFTFTPEDEAFRAELREWLDLNLPKFLEEWGDDGDAGGAQGGFSAGFKSKGDKNFDRTQERRKSWQRRMNEGRWAAINWPKEWQGREASPTQNAIYSEEMARVRAPGIYNPNGIWQIGPMIINYGTEEQKQQWLPTILDASAHWCQGFSEPNAGSDLGNINTVAIRDGDEYIVNGQKIWTSSAHLAKWGLFLFRTDPETFKDRQTKYDGITAFIVDMETPGVECRTIKDIVGDEMLNEVFFTDARIPVSARLGNEAQGWEVAMSTLGAERVGTAGISITMATDLQTLISAARAENPDALRDPEIRERIARLWTEIEQTRLINARALTKIIRKQNNWPEVPLAKLQWSSISQKMAELALDLLGEGATILKGGAGAIDGGSWARNYSWQRYTSIGAGATEIQKNIIAKKALKLAKTRQT